jgi:hypothetical protein
VGVSAESLSEAESAPVFTVRRTALMAVVGVFAFCALLVLTTYATDLEDGNNGGGHALSKSAIAFSGLAKALKILGEPVLISRHRLPAGRREGLLIETPPPGAADRDVTPMGFAGPVLVVLPKWVAIPDVAHRGWVRQGFLIPPRGSDPKSLFALAKPVRRAGISRPRLIGLSAPFATNAPVAVGPVDSLQSEDLTGWANWTPVLTDERGATIMARAPYGPVYLLSDPDLLNNLGMRDFDTFAGGVGLVNRLRAGNGPVIFDVTLNGLERQRSALRLLFDPPFLAVTLCLAAAAGLAAYQAFCRFGPVRRTGRALALGKEALADNSAALVRLAGREHRMAAPYAVLTRELAAKALGAPRDLTGEALMTYLDRLGARRSTQDTLSVLTLLAATTPDRSRLISLAKRLHHWRAEMTGEI